MNQESAQNLEAFLNEAKEESSGIQVEVSCIYFPEDERELVTEFVEHANLKIIDIAAEDHPDNYLKPFFAAVMAGEVVVLNVFNFAPDLLGKLKQIVEGEIVHQFAGDEESSSINLIQAKAKIVCMMNDEDYTSQDFGGVFGSFCSVQK